MSEAVILAELALRYATKLQEIAILFRSAEGGDITHEQVNASAVARDAALLRAELAMQEQRS